MSKAYPFVHGGQPPALAWRPKCKCCSKPLRPEVHHMWRYKDEAKRVLAQDGHQRKWTGRYQGQGRDAAGQTLFCSNQCAVAFAQAAYQMMEERKKKVSQSC